MVKLVGPLFSESATGPLKDFGSFRMGRHGPELYWPGERRYTRTTAQDEIRTAFTKARAAWKRLDPETSPDWPAYWAAWWASPPEEGLSLFEAFLKGMQPYAPTEISARALATWRGDFLG